MEAPIKIYHNPRCGKSRQALAILNDKGVEPEVIEYMKTPLSAKELKEVLKLLGMKPHDLVRKGEAIYKEQYKGKELSDDQWVAAMIEHPKLMERAIVVKGDKAVVARPPELVNDLLA